MDLREARELLRVDETIDAKELERAYLRAVKRHKPERDPEGFQRVREAYDQLRACAPLPATHEELTEPEDRSGPDPLPPLRESLRDDLEAPERGLFDEQLFHPGELDEAPRTDDAPPGLDHAAALARDLRWREIWSASPERRVELLQETLDEDPEDEEVRDELVHELLASERGREAAELARDAAPSVRSYLFDEIARRSPADLSDDMLDALRGTGSLAVVPVLIERGAIDEAERCVEAAIDGLANGYVDDILEAILALAAADAGETARTLLERSTTALDRLGLATRVSQQDALTMLLLGELFAASGELPTTARDIALSGIRASDDFEQAREQAKRWATVESADAQRAVDALARCAPNLSTVLGDAFQPPRSRRRATSATSSPPPWWAILVAMAMLSGLGRAATRCDYSPSPPAMPAIAHDRLSYACEVAPARCNAIRALSSALEAQDCARALPAGTDVRAAITALEGDGPRAALALVGLQRMIAELESTCPQDPHSSPSP